MINIDHAATNLRWCVRAWNDGEMKELALFLFRKAMAQLVLEDIGDEARIEILAAYLTPPVVDALQSYNDEVNSSSVQYEAWTQKVRSLLIC